MIKKPKYILIGGVVLLCLIIMISYAFSRDWTFRGNVIDYDTKEPIEGAVVVAEWQESRDTIAGGSSRYKDVKETLTDKNGEWVIVGPKGRRYDPVPFWSFITGIHYTMHPGFIIFKPGYEVSSFMSHTSLVSFTARVYVDKKHKLEGIVLTLREREDEYIRRIDKEIPEKRIPYRVPFIPMKDPERRLRNLEIPFDYDADQVMRISPEVRHQFSYELLGLRKLKTREERLRAMPGPVGGEGALEKQREFIRLLNEEAKNLGLRGRYN